MHARKSFRPRPGRAPKRSTPPLQSETRIKTVDSLSPPDDFDASLQASVDAALAELDQLEMTPSQHAALAPPPAPQLMPKGMPPLPFKSSLPHNMPPLPTRAMSGNKKG